MKTDLKTTKIAKLRLDGRIWTCVLECGCTVERPCTLRTATLKTITYAPGEFTAPWGLTPQAIFGHTC